MELLRSSILGKEFVNFRKTTMREDRKSFSNGVREMGVGNVPIVVDSVDRDLSEAISDRTLKRYDNKYGRAIVCHMDKDVRYVLREIKVILIKNDCEQFANQGLRLGLEDGTFPVLDQDLGTLYKKHRNKNDKILYLLLTKEESMFGYIMSIVSYVTSFLGFGFGVEKMKIN
jgi:hypothetical protein